MGSLKDGEEHVKNVCACMLASAGAAPGRPQRVTRGSWLAASG